MTDPVVTPPAAATTPPPAAPPVTSWLDGFAPEVKGYVETKGFKTPADVVDSYRNLEKVMGVPQDRIIKLAEKMRDDNGVLTPEGRAIFNKLGTPADAKDYQFDIPKENGSPELAEAFRKLAFDEGMPKSAAEKAVKFWNDYQANAVKVMKENSEAMAKAADQNLRKDWGQAYDQNLNIAKEAARTLGMEQKQVDALHATLGQAEALKLFHKLGSAVGEGKFVTGTSTSVLMTPDQAQSQIKALTSDRDFGQRLSKGDAEAIGKWTRLHEQAYPGQFESRA